MNKNVAKRLLALAVISLIILMGSSEGTAQDSLKIKGSVKRIKVHGTGLEGNLEGDSPDRDVSIYLPPGYSTNLQKRYPVIYFLHGFTDDDAQWYGFKKHWINMPAIIDKLFTSGSAKEMIVVTPNAYTRYQGSMYSNSITTGNWEDFVANELVAYIDRHYRTLAQAGSRGLAGHSMGGYGSIRIGQKHPEVFSSVYLMSPCCLMPNFNTAPNAARISAMDSIKTIADFEKADFGTKATFASAAAWSPNPAKPPFYLDLPYEKGQLNPMVQTKWWSNSPLSTLDQYIFNLKQLHALAFDAGTKDESIAEGITALDEALNKYGRKHTFEIYEGDHVNRIGERIEQKMVPFFSNNLLFAIKPVKPARKLQAQ